nr:MULTISPECIES: prepilin peptidase [unclassified Gemella]
MALVYIFSYNYLFFINYIDYWLVLILIFIAIEDINTYEINVKLQLILFILIIVKFLCDFNMQQIIIFFILTLFYNIVYLITKEGIGYGDIKLFSSLSLILSLIEGVYLFAYTFIYAGFFALYLIIVKKESKKYKVALAPYICLAYITVILQREIILWL